MGGTALRRALWAVLFSILAGTAAAKTLPLAEGLVALNSPAGEQALLRSPAKAAYWDLSLQFVTQKTQSFCGVASMTMVFNAMAIPAPAVPEYEPYKTFTQDNVLDDATEAVIPKATILKMGMTLDQLGAAIATKPVEATVRHAADSNVDRFRQEASTYLARPGHFVIVNYLR